MTCSICDPLPILGEGLFGREFCRVQSAVRRVQSAVRRVQSAVRHVQSPRAVRRVQSAIRDVPTAMCQPPCAFRRSPPRVVRHVRSAAVRRPASAFRHRPSVHQPSAFPSAFRASAIRGPPWRSAALRIPPSDVGHRPSAVRRSAIGGPRIGHRPSAIRIARAVGIPLSWFACSSALGELRSVLCFLVCVLILGQSSATPKAGPRCDGWVTIKNFRLKAAFPRRLTATRIAVEHYLSGGASCG
jgi:hypothetical protein